MVLTLFVSSRQLLKLQLAVQRDAEISHLIGLGDDSLLTKDVVYPVNLYELKSNTNLTSCINVKT